MFFGFFPIHFSLDSFLCRRWPAPVFQLVFSLLQGELLFPHRQPLHVLTRGRQQIFLSTAVDFLGERAPSLTISVHKNGQLFQNRFPRKRIILHQNKFEKIYLKYLPSWRITKPINISKIWPLICMTMEKNFYSKY